MHCNCLGYAADLHNGVDCDRLGYGKVKSRNVFLLEVGGIEGEGVLCRRHVGEKPQLPPPFDTVVRSTFVPVFVRLIFVPGSRLHWNR